MIFNGGVYNPTAIFTTANLNPMYIPKRSMVVKNKILRKRKKSRRK